MRTFLRLRASTLLGVYCLVSITSASRCANADGAIFVWAKADGSTGSKPCNWIAEKVERKSLCDDINLLTNEEIWHICSKQCQEKSGCGLRNKSGTRPVPTKVPGLSSSVDSLVRRELLGSYPTGPYITPATASERIVLPDPAVPNLAASRSNCPFLDSGLVDWHDPATWGDSGVPSTPGGNVDIPSGARVLLSRSVGLQLGLVSIPSNSELIIGENPNGIEIDADGFDVAGALTIGSETCRIETPVTITLRGERPADAVTNPREPTYKGIYVTGVLDIHGKRFFHTWSRLAKTVYPGEDVIMLQNTVNWQPGQQIIIVTSAIKDARDFHQNEVRTIANIHPDPAAVGVGAIVYLTEFVQYKHVANTNYQVEVGLLTRSVLVQGASEDSELTDQDTGGCKFDSWLFGSIDQSMPCPGKELTGFGGHMMVASGGRGYVEGVELYRMGQTNVMGRYPMHFHHLGDCPECYFRESSVHRSFYRCISIHGTHMTTVSENVAYDVVGYCYYLEDGIEEYNEISFNLAAHIHYLGPGAVSGQGQETITYIQSETLTLPADVTASGFYITNVHNYIFGNAASGGWAGFAFPSLSTPLQNYRNEKKRPSTTTTLTLDGNTAHSTAFWWSHAAAFYWGGNLYYNSNDQMEYIPGRSQDFQRDNRRPCNVNPCDAPYNDCIGGCPESEKVWNQMTNSKAFLSAGVGLNSWSGTMDISGFESHDNGLSMEALEKGFWIDNMLSVCRTGEPIAAPPGMQLNTMGADGFHWYDTRQDHIITDTTFRNCGLRSEAFDQYDQSSNRGCPNDDSAIACSPESSVFLFLTHSDQFAPEIMQATRNIRLDNCGRRFRFENDLLDTVSARALNWLDVDGSVSSFGEETLIGSGVESVRSWWGVDDEVLYDPQAPLRFIKKNNGPMRSIGYFNMRWDDSLHSQVGYNLCKNDGDPSNCWTIGHFRHLGHKFSPTYNGDANQGMPITANAKIVGPVGGYGWLLQLNGGAPRSLELSEFEIDPDTVMMVTIPYPPGTTFSIYAGISAGCEETSAYSCREDFQEVSSIGEVRLEGNKYYVDESGAVTFRVVALPNNFIGNPEWFIPTYDTPGRGDTPFALPTFQRGGAVLPLFQDSAYLKIEANCGGTGPYCSDTPWTYDPDVCPAGYQQVAYDRCCQTYEGGVASDKCIFADSSQNF